MNKDTLLNAQMQDEQIIIHFNTNVRSKIVQYAESHNMSVEEAIEKLVADLLKKQATERM
jgi:hypothetical protein